MKKKEEHIKFSRDYYQRHWKRDTNNKVWGVRKSRNNNNGRKCWIAVIYLGPNEKTEKRFYYGGAAGRTEAQAKAAAFATRQSFREQVMQINADLCNRWFGNSTINQNFPSIEKEGDYIIVDKDEWNDLMEGVKANAKLAGRYAASQIVE